MATSRLALAAALLLACAAVAHGYSGSKVRLNARAPAAAAPSEHGKRRPVFTLLANNTPPKHAHAHTRPHTRTQAIPLTLPAPGAGGVTPNFPGIPPSTVIPSYMTEWYAVHSSSGFKLWGTTPSSAFPKADRTVTGLNPPTLQVFHWSWGGFGLPALSAASSKGYKPAATDLPHIVEMQARDATSFYGYAMFEGNDGLTYPAVGFKVDSLWSIFLGGRYGDDGPGRRKLLGCVICACSGGTPTDGADPYEICGAYACPYSNCCCPI